MGGMLVVQEFGFFVGGWHLMAMMKNEAVRVKQKKSCFACLQTFCNIPLSSGTFLFLTSSLVF